MPRAQTSAESGAEEAASRRSEGAASNAPATAEVWARGMTSGDEA